MSRVIALLAFSLIASAASADIVQSAGGGGTGQSSFSGGSSVVQVAPGFGGSGGVAPLPSLESAVHIGSGVSMSEEGGIPLLDLTTVSPGVSPAMVDAGQTAVGRDFVPTAPVLSVPSTPSYTNPSQPLSNLPDMAILAHDAEGHVANSFDFTAVASPAIAKPPMFSSDFLFNTFLIGLGLLGPIGIVITRRNWARM